MKGLADAIVAKVAPEEDQEMSEEDEKKFIENEMEYQASRILDAVKNGMATKLNESLKAHYALCEEYEEKFGDEEY